MLNGGQSVQVALERNSSSTTLSVLTNGIPYETTSDAGLQLLQDENYEQFPFGESTPLPDMVYYPHSITRPSPHYTVSTPLFSLAIPRKKSSWADTKFIPLNALF